MSSATYYPYTTTTSSLPLSVPSKGNQQNAYARQLAAYNQLSASPPERPASIASSSGAGLYSSASSQYASSDYDSSSAGATSVDLLDYMNERLAQAYNPIPQDRSVARQAQTSGQLNAKTQELLALQAEARARLAKTRANFADGMRVAKEVQRDLEWTQRKAHALNRRAAEKYPQQYSVASARYPAPDAY